MRDTHPSPPRLIGGGLVNVTNSFVVLNGPWGGWGVPSSVVTVVGDVVRAMCVMVRPLLYYSLGTALCLGC